MWLMSCAINLLSLSLRHFLDPVRMWFRCGSDVAQMWLGFGLDLASTCLQRVFGCGADSLVEAKGKKGSSCELRQIAAI